MKLTWRSSLLKVEVGAYPERGTIRDINPASPTNIGLAGNTKGGKYHYTIDLLFDWFALVCSAKKIVSSHTADSKPVKQEVNSTVILPPLVFPGLGFKWSR